MTDLPPSHSDTSGFAAGLLVGLILGGAGGYLLSTDKGQELLENLKEGAGDHFREFLQNPALAEKLADLEKTVEQARAVMAHTADDARAHVHAVASQVAEVTAPPAPKKNFFRSMGESLGK